MNLIAKVAELKELEKKASAESLPGPQANGARFCLEIRNAGPAMLAVLGQFREGDAGKIDRIGSMLRGWIDGHPLAQFSDEEEMLNRLQEAARLMEAECEK
jgi:hypothetical protein